MKALEGRSAGFVKKVIQAKAKATDKDDKIRKGSAASVVRTRVQNEGELRIESFGTLREPCFVCRDPFGDRGQTIKTYFIWFCREHGIPLPNTVRSKRWMSWSEMHAGRHVDTFKLFQMLDPMANRILDELRNSPHQDSLHLNTKDRGYCSKDINVYSKGGGTGPHQDAQEFGRLVFVFCAGLSCDSSVWLGGRPVPNNDRQASAKWLKQQGFTEVPIQMQSGDVMIFEGKTWHQVRECVPHSSPPVMKGDWLQNQRLSILVRKR